MFIKVEESTRGKRKQGRLKVGNHRQMALLIRLDVEAKGGDSQKDINDRFSFLHEGRFTEILRIGLLKKKQT